MKNLVLGVIIASSSTLTAQDPHFSQLYARPSQLNVALVAAQPDHSSTAGLLLREQWAQVAPYQTVVLSFEQRVATGRLGRRQPHSGIGIGGFVLYDAAGDGALTTAEMGLQGAWHAQLGNRLMISSGVQASYVRKHLQNADDLIFIPPTNLVFQTASFLDFGLGTSVRFEEERFGFDVGVAGYHLTQPMVVVSIPGGSRLPRKLQIHGRAHVDFGKLRIEPQFAHAIMAGATNSVILLTSTYELNKFRLFAGVGGRINDAPIYIIGAGFGEWAGRLSIDHGQGNQAGKQRFGGAAELAVTYSRKARGSFTTPNVTF